MNIAAKDFKDELPDTPDEPQAASGYREDEGSGCSNKRLSRDRL
jgi:hypothetical protein